MNVVPLDVFIALTIVLFVLLFLVFRVDHPINLGCGLLSVLISFFLAKTSINGSLVMTFGGITSSDTIVSGSTAIQNSGMYYIYMFISLISVGLVIKMIANEIIYQTEPILEDEI